MSTSSTDNRSAIVVIAVIAIPTSIMIFVALLSAQPSAPSPATPDPQVVRVTSPMATGSPPSRPTQSTPGTTSLTTTMPPQSQSPSLALEPVLLDAQPFETARLVGTYIGSNGPATLRVQHHRRAGWVNFPLPVTTDPAGHFTAYVELGRPGIHRLRVVEPGTGTASPVVLLTISS
jgi:hypothetical protein